MSLISILLVAFGLSMDAFAVSVTGGASVKKSRFYSALKVAFFFGMFQALMPILGWIIGTGLKNYITFFDHWVAFILLSIIGVKMIYESLRIKKSAIDLLSTKMILALGLATSIDALIVGFSFAFLATSIIFSIIVIGLITFTLSIIGFHAGNKIGSVLKNKTGIIGGIILIGIGFKILLSHLF